jgi:hypothetical protein
MTQDPCTGAFLNTVMSNTMKTKFTGLILLLLFLRGPGFGQTVVVTDDATYTSGQSSSVLDVKSNSRGFLPPRVTSSARLGIVNPARGLIVYQTDAPVGLFYFDGLSWQTFASGSGSQWTTSGSDIYFSSGKVGIGTSNPQYALSVYAASQPVRIQGLSRATGKTLMAIDTVTGIVSTSDILFSGMSTLIKGTYSIDVPSVAANGNVTQTVSVTGALAGDCVVVTPSGPIGASGCVIIGSSYVSDTGVVSILFVNVSASSVDPDAMNFYITLMR